jgi:phosphatidylglycerophosphatase A
MQMLSLPVYLLIVVILFIFGVWICERTAKALQVHDHPGIVWDEIVGFLVTMILAPQGWIWWLAGFLLFRVFDIFKPWPIKILDQRVGGGFGIMIDDVLAGIFAAICLQLLHYFYIMNFS